MTSFGEALTEQAPLSSPAGPQSCLKPEVKTLPWATANMPEAELDYSTALNGELIGQETSPEIVLQ